MADNATASGSQHPQTNFANMAAMNINRNMTDFQLKQALSHITSAASATYASPAPEVHTKSKWCSEFSQILHMVIHHLSFQRT